MTITTMSSRDFNQDTSRAKRATKDGPVFVTDRGVPAHVLLSIEDYHRLSGDEPSVADLLAMPEGFEDVEFDPPRMNLVTKPADFS